jgi:predicted nucleotidyltransferase
VIVEELKKIIGHYPQVDTAYLYGTGAKEKLRPNSDIDVAIMLSEVISEKEIASVHTNVICNIEAAIHREADVKILNYIDHLPLLHEILSKGILLVDRDPVKRKAFAIKKNIEYLDFLPHYERMLTIYSEKLRKRGTAKSPAG